eukprot:13281219-Alexandrium_andersonii.AAC.1
MPSRALEDASPRGCKPQVARVAACGRERHALGGQDGLEVPAPSGSAPSRKLTGRKPLETSSAWTRQELRVRGRKGLSAPAPRNLNSSAAGAERLQA